MTLQPPRSSLFPYTTLFRSGRRKDWVAEALEQLSNGWHRTAGLGDRRVAELVRQDRIDILLDLSMHTKDSRSEEHTSELQSHVNLVCRLLLEKKKKQTQNNS